MILVPKLYDAVFRKTEILSSKISEMIPTFCSVYVILKGKLASARPAEMETNGSNRDDNSDESSIGSFSTHSSHLRRGKNETRGSKFIILFMWMKCLKLSKSCVLIFVLFHHACNITDSLA